MLRLRPSELTLTPDDVDETFRRVALRQTSGAREHWTMQPRQHPSRPILRRGPQRAVRDAITVLGNIPILQPQQAVLVSVNDGDHVSDQEVAQSAVHDISSAASNSSPHDRDDESIAPPVFPVSSESGTVQLPFRPRPDSLELSAPITEDEQAEDASHTPRNRPSEPTRPTPTRIVDTEPAQSPSVDSIERTPGLRGGGHSTNTHHDITQDATRAPLPMHQIQTLGSPAQRTPLGDPTKSPSSSTDQPMLYLKGYFAQTPRRARYRFREHLPHTEPRRSSSRQAAVARSLSSGAAPASVTCPSKSPDDPSDDVFGTRSTPESSHGSRRDSYNVFDPGHCAANVSNLPSTSGSKQQADQSGARPRQSSSEATNASAVYSWYGSLPSETRFPSSEHSAHHETSSHAPPSDSSTYSSNVVGSSPHGLSPLPSMPYTRIHEPASSSAPGYVGGVSEGYVEAATAAAHDLQSPLDPYAEHYQRQLQAQHALPYFCAHGNPTVSSVGGAQMRPPSHGQNIRPDDPSVFRQTPQRSSEYPTYSATYGSHVFARTEQRSSENAPVVGSFHHGDVPRHGRVQTQRAAYERMQNPGRTTYTTTRGVEMAPSRHSAPQSISPYDMSNRPRDYTSHHTGRTGLEQYHRSSTPFPLHQPRQASQSQPQDVPHTESPNPSANRSLPPSTDTPRYAAPPRVYRTTRGAFGLHPTRDSPVTGVAFAQGSGTTSRRSDSPFLRPSTTSTTSSTTVSTTARTRRRVPPAQRDQENDDEAGVMRREEGNVRARYGEDAQRAMWMNETPPRVGRVERRMV